jgi:predicted membrane channel-forming protein YqfA (hemolysin III family)
MAPERSNRVTSVIRFVFLALAVSWAGLIFYLSSQPGIDAPMLFPGQDKLFHLIVFAILGFFIMGAMKITGNGYRRSQVWLVVLIVVLYGISDEFHQYFVPGRSTESLDALADGIGGILGAWAMFYVARLFVRPSRIRSAPTDV